MRFFSGGDSGAGEGARTADEGAGAGAGTTAGMGVGAGAGGDDGTGNGESALVGTRGDVGVNGDANASEGWWRSVGEFAKTNDLVSTILRTFGRRTPTLLRCRCARHLVLRSFRPRKEALHEVRAHTVVSNVTHNLPLTFESVPLKICEKGRPCWLYVLRGLYSSSGGYPNMGDMHERLWRRA